MKLALAQLSDGVLCFDATAGGKYVLSAGYADCSLRIENVDNQKVKAASIGHRDIVTCMSISADGTLLFTGSKDATCCLWRINCNHDLRDEMIDIFGAPELMQQHRQTELLTLAKRFWGNACCINDVCLDSELGIAASTGITGNVVLHSLWDETRSMVLCSDMEGKVEKLLIGFL